MSDRITIDFAADTAGVERGAQTIVESLEDVEGALDDVSGSGDDLSDGLIKNMRDAGRAAGKSADDIERDLQKAFTTPGEAAKRLARIAKNELGSVEDSAGKVEGKSNEIGSALDGVGQAAKDALSGDLGGAAESAVKSLGSVAGAAGGIAGLAVGAAVGIASGIIGTISEAFDEEAKASEDRIKNMYDNFLESGVDYFSDEQLAKATQAITGDPEKLAAAKKQAEELGVSVTEIILAQASAGEQRSGIQAKILDELKQSENVEVSRNSKEALRIALLQGYLAGFKDLTKEQQTAAQAAEIQKQVQGQITGENKLTTEEIQKQNKAIADRPTQQTVKVIPDTSALDRALTGRQVNVTVRAYTRGGKEVF